MNQALIVKLHSIHFSIKMDNCNDLNSFQIKLEQTELIIKDEPEEVAIENSSLDDKYDTSLPTLAIKDQLLNTQVEVVPSNSKFEMKIKEDYPETSITEDTSKSKMNVGNYDFDALEIKLEHEEVIIKDEPEEVIEEASSLEIIQFDTNPVTLGIRDRTGNTRIKVDPSICRIEDLLRICTCTVEVIMIPQHVFATKMEQYLGSKLQNIAEADYDDEECMAQEDTIKCKVCTQRVTQISFKKHMLDHKITKHNGEFKKHMLLHDDKKSFKCHECNKCFTLNGNLKRHMLIHKELKPFKCQQCNKCFTLNSDLKRHKLIHMGLKSFKCQQCNKCFTQNSNLKAHLLIHKGLKPFKCQQCNKCFTFNGNCKRHMLIHKGLKSEEGA